MAEAREECLPLFSSVMSALCAGVNWGVVKILMTRSSPPPRTACHKVSGLGLRMFKPVDDSNRQPG